MSRARARALRGERAIVTEPFETGKNISVIGALTLKGARAQMAIEGAIDGQALEQYVRHILVPELHSKDIVIWDNAPIHRSTSVRRLIEATGARILPLPSYSPDFNPKENCISKVKAELKRIKANTPRKLMNALKRAYVKVTRSDARGWFEHCGYSAP